MGQAAANSEFKTKLNIGTPEAGRHQNMKSKANVKVDASRNIKTTFHSS